MPTFSGAKMNIDNGVFSAHCVANFIKGKGSDAVVMVHNTNPDTKPTIDFTSTLVHKYGLRVADMGDSMLFMVCNLNVREFAELLAEAAKVTDMKSMEFKVPPKSNTTPDVSVIYRDTIDGPKKSMKLSDFQKVCDDYESEPIKFDDGFIGYLKKREPDTDDELRCCRGEGCRACMSDDERPAPYVGHDLD